MTDFLSLDNTSSRQFIISRKEKVPDAPVTVVKKPKIRSHGLKPVAPAKAIIAVVPAPADPVDPVPSTPNIPPEAPPTPKDPLTLHVGKAFNPVHQTVVEEGGLHKVAPVALTVSGAVILHDLGYSSSKKDLVPLYLDPYTNRVTTYRHK